MPTRVFCRRVADTVVVDVVAVASGVVFSAWGQAVPGSWNFLGS